MKNELERMLIHVEALKEIYDDNNLEIDPDFSEAIEDLFDQAAMIRRRIAEENNPDA